ncbi:MAG: L-2-amino-thiazoline-4-carboxylic acid hydrolase [Spirochaetales bacterium]|nr:L-2-amino-thiazoline-4-carboxylic acid hydrolase [Spirochaetales bacterium]
MVKCPYHDMCTKYGCPEIVKGFCDADDICYGYNLCDFKVHTREK